METTNESPALTRLQRRQQMNLRFRAADERRKNRSLFIGTASARCCLLLSCMCEKPNKQRKMQLRELLLFHFVIFLFFSNSGGGKRKIFASPPPLLPFVRILSPCFVSATCVFNNYLDSLGQLLGNLRPDATDAKPVKRINGNPI